MAVWSVLKMKLSKLLNIEWEDRETEDSYLIERILYLVRERVKVKFINAKKVIFI